MEARAVAHSGHAHANCALLYSAHSECMSQGSAPLCVEADWHSRAHVLAILRTWNRHERSHAVFAGACCKRPHCRRVTPMLEKLKSESRLMSVCYYVLVSGQQGIIFLSHCRQKRTCATSTTSTLRDLVAPRKPMWSCGSGGLWASERVSTWPCSSCPSLHSAPALMCAASQLRRHLIALQARHDKTMPSASHASVLWKAIRGICRDPVWMSCRDLGWRTRVD